jgi:cell wall-associated NlpC family hydrolase
MGYRRSPQADHDLAALHERAQRRRSEIHTSVLPFRHVRQWPTHTAQWLRTAPPRFWLHTLLLTLVPLVILGNQHIALSPMRVPAEQPPPQEQEGFAFQVLPLAPISLNSEPAGGEPPVADAAFAEIVALEEVQTTLGRDQRFAPLTFTSRVIGDKVNLRNGPGQAYDILGTAPNDTPLTLLAVAGDWFTARTAEGAIVWVAAELTADAPQARSILPIATTIPPPPPPKVAVVREANVNLRDGPGTAYVALTKLDPGSTIDLVGQYAGWFQVQLPDQRIGWVTGEFLTLAEGVVERIEVLTTIPDPNPALVATTDGQVNLRGGPGTDYPKLTTVRAGTRLDLIARYDDWFKVRTDDGKTAWIAQEVLPVSAYLTRRVPVTQAIPARPKPQQVARPNSTNKPAPVPAAQAGSVAAFAAQFVGTPYVWGGSQPGGFDCSGFTKYVYGQFGLSLPHSAAAQYSTRYGAIIDKSALVPGDIVFFANTYKRGISHVGVYVGNGMVAQALAPGVPLSIVSMNSSYWQSKYYGAIRPYF